jgi:MFS transporter, NRE family, putaive nickel resistance protein
LQEEFPLKTSLFFVGLHNPIFRRLYIAQSISLLGDALSWLGLALLAWELAGSSAPLVLAGALTLRVTAFVLFSPLAGVLADTGVPVLRDRLDRKQMMVTTQLARLILVCMLPLVHAVWQIYVLVLCFHAYLSSYYSIGDK